MSSELGSCQRPDSPWSDLAISAVYSVVAIFLHGYQFAAGDQNLWIPFVRRVGNPNLYPDPLFGLSYATQGSYAVFPRMMHAALTIVPDLEVLFLILYLTTHILFFWSLIRLVRATFSDPMAVYIILLLALRPHIVSGTATYIYEVYLHPRYMSMAFALAAINALVRGRETAASALVGISFLIHPLTAVVPCGAVFCSALASFDLRKICVCAAAFLPTGATAIYLFLGGPSDPPEPLDRSYLHFIQVDLEGGYYFPAFWSPWSWAQLLAMTALMAYCIHWAVRTRGLTDADRKLMLTAAVSLMVFLIWVVGTTVWPIMIIIKTQLARGTVFEYWIAFIYLSGALAASYRQGGVARALAISTVACFSFQKAVPAVILMFLIWHSLSTRGMSNRRTYVRKRGWLTICLAMMVAAIAVIRLPRPVDWPHKYSESAGPGRGYFSPIEPFVDARSAAFVDVQFWALRNTRPEDVFLVPPIQYPSFRMFSERGAIITGHDGSPILFSRKYAKLYHERAEATKDYDEMTYEQIQDLARRYGANYAVIRSESSSIETFLYDNGVFRIVAVAKKI